MVNFLTAIAFERHVAENGAVFKGNLDLRGCTGLAALPDNLSVGDRITLPDHLCGEMLWEGAQIRVENIDGITMVMDRHMPADGFDIWKARYFGKPIAGMESCFIARIGEHYAHGDTVRAAIEDAREKVFAGQGAADIVAGIKARGEVSFAEFRALTGACREGLRQGLQERGLPGDTESLSLAEAVRLAAGNSFGDRFIGLVSGAAPAKKAEAEA